MTLRLLHFADLHLGVETYGRIDPATGLNSRVGDFSRCLAGAFDAAIDQQVDLVLFAGDAYKTCDPNPTFQREFAAQLQRLHEASIPIVLVVGNHDTPAAFGRATSLDIFAALQLENIYVFRRPGIQTVPTRSGPVQVAGLPWPTRHVLRTDDDYRQLDQEAIKAKIEAICSEQIAEFARRLDPAQPAVLTAHITAAEAVFSGSERTALIGQDPALLTSALANDAFDYVALGHIHRYQDLNPQASPPVVYSGSLERLDFGEEHDEKGFCLVCIEGDGEARSTSSEFVPTPARRFLTIEVKIDDDDEDPTQTLLDAIAEAALEDAVVRVVYHVPAGYTPRVETPRLHEALNAAHYLAGIHPRIAPRERKSRSQVTEDLSIRDALDKYIDNHDDLKGEREALLTRAAQLEALLDAALEDAEPPAAPSPLADNPTASNQTTADDDAPPREGSDAAPAVAQDALPADEASQEAPEQNTAAAALEAPAKETAASLPTSDDPASAAPPTPAVAQTDASPPT